MQVVLNGQLREFDDGLTVAALLQSLHVTGRVAVEVNEEIVSRSEHVRHALRDGDRVEIVRAVGGG